MYSAYKKLNKQGDNIQPWHTPFPVLNQSVVPCLVLTVASYPAYMFLRRQVRWSDIPISLKIFHSLLWSTQWKAVSLFIEKHSHFPYWYLVPTGFHPCLLPYSRPAPLSWFIFHIHKCALTRSMVTHHSCRRSCLIRFCLHLVTLVNLYAVLSHLSKIKTFLWYSSTLKLLRLPMLRSVWLLYKNYLQTFAKGAGFSLLLPRLSTIGSIVTNGNISCPLGKYISWHQKYWVQLAFRNQSAITLSIPMYSFGCDKNERHWMLFIWGISQGSVCSEQP